MAIQVPLPYPSTWQFFLVYFHKSPASARHKPVGWPVLSVRTLGASSELCCSTV